MGRRTVGRRERNWKSAGTGTKPRTEPEGRVEIRIRVGGTRVTFRLRDHTADVAVEATDDTLSGVFAAVADGLAAAMCDDVPPDGDDFVFTVEAESREALLFDYLDQLIYERDVRSVLPVDNEARVSRVDADATDVTDVADTTDVANTTDVAETRWRVEGRPAQCGRRTGASCRRRRRDW